MTAARAERCSEYPCGGAGWERGGGELWDVPYQKFLWGTPVSPDQHIHTGGIGMPVVILRESNLPFASLAQEAIQWAPAEQQEKIYLSLEQAQDDCRVCLWQIKSAVEIPLDLSEINIPFVIGACCVWHNSYEVKGEMLRQGWDGEADRLLSTSRQRNTRTTTIVVLGG